MNKTQIAQISRLSQVQAFLDRNARLLQPLNEGTARADLDEIMRAIAQQHAAFSEATTMCQNLTAQLGTLRWQLRIRHLAPIAAVARAKAQHAPTDATVRLPRKTARDATLAAAATAAVAAVAKDRKMYLRAGLPEDFVEQLVAATDAFKAARDAAASLRIDSVSATMRIVDLVRRGNTLVRLFDALVIARASRDHNPRLGAEWHSVRTLRPPKPVARAGRTEQPDAPAV